ncbi:MAG TPA: TraM recognition domain-containing protein [Solirubrobacteraceae bacterium]|nr:TraM recognition domain-containing protein [Solirubrobacteraceae bacterium]
MAPAALAAGVSASLRGRRWHREDISAGMDLARAAGSRSHPGSVLMWFAHLPARRRVGAGASPAARRNGELVVGHARHGRLVSIPFAGSRGGAHTLLVGATGSGKTVTQTWMAVCGVRCGMGAVVVDPKGDAAMRVSLAEAATSAGREFVEWTPAGPSTYNPLARGSDTEIADKVLAGERFTEPHYLRQAQRFLGHVVRSLRAAGIETSLRTISTALDPGELELLTRTLPEPAATATQTYLDALSPRQLADIGGVRDRLAILAESDVGGWLEPRPGTPRLDLLEAVRRRAVVYFGLDADRRPLLMQMLGAAIVQDLQTTVAALQAQPVPTVVVIDEFSALAADQVVRLFGRARSAGFCLVLGTQELADLRAVGRGALLDQILGNLSTLIAHRQVVPGSAELVCQLAGSEGAWRTSWRAGRPTSRTRAREPVLLVEDVMHLAPGCAAAVVFGDRARTTIARIFAASQPRTSSARVRP